MKTSQRVVIYVLAEGQYTPGSDLAEAQRLAIEKSLPLMVVSCIDPRLRFASQQIAFESLERAETALAKLSIPLMVMLANPQAGISALRMHVQPYIWRSKLSVRTPSNVLKHTYAWSGHVQSVSAVRSYAEAIETGIQQLCL